MSFLTFWFCLATAIASCTATEHFPGFHHLFNNIGTNYVNLQPVSTKDGGCRIFYFTNQTSGHRNLKTVNYMKYADSPSTVQTIDPIWPVSFIFKSDKLLTGLEGTENEVLIAFNDQYDVQVSNDEGLTWRFSCKNCTKIIFEMEAWFDNDYTATWDESNKVWVGAFRKLVTDGVYIMAARDIKEWTVGNRMFNYSLANVHGIFRLSDNSNTQGKTILIFYNKTATELRIYGREILIKVDGANGKPTAELIPEVTPLDHGQNLRYLIPVNDGKDIKPQKTLIPLLNNRYIPYKTNDVNWVLMMGTPRVLSYAVKNGKLVFRQVPKVSFTDDSIWRHFRFEPYRIGRDKDPFACMRAVSFALSAEIDTGSKSDLVFQIRGSSGFNQFTEIGFKDGRCYIDRRKTGLLLNFNAANLMAGYDELWESNQKIEGKDVKFMAISDTFSVEVYCGDGEIVLSAVVLPDPTFDRIKLLGKDGDLVKYVDIRKLILKP